MKLRMTARRNGIESASSKYINLTDLDRPKFPVESIKNERSNEINREKLAHLAAGAKKEDAKKASFEKAFNNYGVEETKIFYRDMSGNCAFSPLALGISADPTTGRFNANSLRLKSNWLNILFNIRSISDIITLDSAMLVDKNGEISFHKINDMELSMGYYESHNIDTSTTEVYIGADALRYLIDNIDIPQRTLELTSFLFSEYMKATWEEADLTLEEKPGYWKINKYVYCKPLVDTNTNMMLEFANLYKNDRFNADEALYTLQYDDEDKDALKYHKRALRFLNNSIKDNWYSWIIPVFTTPVKNMLAKDSNGSGSHMVNPLIQATFVAAERLTRLSDRFLLQSVGKMMEVKNLLFEFQKQYNKLTYTKFDPDNKREGYLEIISGKEGLIRDSILGKEVCFTGRGVISPDPNLRIDQCGIPYLMLKDIMSLHLLNRKGIDIATEMNEDKIRRALEELVEEIPVWLTRQPSLHRLSRQGFWAVILPDAMNIKIPPPVTDGYNADFDGDQMAVSCPQTDDAIRETKRLMLATYSILRPRNGSIFSMIKHEVIYGVYILTKEIKEYMTDNIIPVKINTPSAIHDMVMSNPWAKAQVNGIEVIVGRAYLYTIMREFMDIVGVPEASISKLMQGILEKPSNKDVLVQLFTRVFNTFSINFEMAAEQYVTTIDKLSMLGRVGCTLAPPTVDIEVINLNKADYNTEEECLNYELYQKGLLSYEELMSRSSDLEDIIKSINSEVRREMKEQDNKYGIIDLIEAGAKGSYNNVDLIYGMKGSTYIKQLNSTVYVESNYLNGLNTIEHCLSSQATVSQIMLKTLEPANTGYSMRKMVHAAVDNKIRKHDCGTNELTRISMLDLSSILRIQPMSSDREKLEKIFFNIVFGRYDATGEIDYDRAKAIAKNCYSDFIKMITPVDGESESDRIERLQDLKPYWDIRTLATCKDTCVKCYGMDLMKWAPVELNSSVGADAATAIGEVGTQSTMKVFQQGGKKVEMSDSKQIEKILSIAESDPTQSSTSLSSMEGIVSLVGEQVYIGGRPSPIYTYGMSQEEIYCTIIPGRYIRKGEFLIVGQGCSIDSILRLSDVSRQVFLLTLRLFDKYYNSDMNIKHPEVLIDSLRSFKIISNPENHPAYSIGYYLNKNQAREAEKYGVKTIEEMTSYTTREKKDNSPLAGLAYERTAEALERMCEKIELNVDKSFVRRLIGRVSI